MSGLKVITGPALEPISRIEAREHLRLDEDVDDRQIRIYIQAARNWAENYTGRAFINRTMKMYLDGFSAVDEPLWEGMRTGPSVIKYNNYLQLALNPVYSVTSIKYFSDNDTEYTWGTENYYADIISEPAKIVIRDGGTYPTDLRAANGLEINFIAGYGENPSDVPESIKVAMLQFMSFIYEHRGDYEGSIEAPRVVRSLLDPYKIYRFNSDPYNKLLMTGIG
tara:strand:+ start:195 stop:863 length:669 start_codon:yes stop_codon:yes gene_type:complete